MSGATYLRAGLIGLLVLAGLLYGSRQGWLERAELAVFDIYARAATDSTRTSDDIAILYLTESNIRELGHWPLSDRDLAAALEALAAAGARVIGLDFYRDFPVPPGEEHFARVIRGEGHIIGVHKFGDPRREGVPGPWPLKEHDAPWREGFNDVLPDARGGAVRRALLFQDDGVGGPVDYAFALRVALLALSQDAIHPVADDLHPEWMRLGAATLRPFESGDGGYGPVDDAGYQLLLNFSRAPGEFDHFDLVSLLNGEVEPERIRDRIVLVGSNALSLRDFFAVPPSTLDAPIPGIALHGHIVQQLLDMARGDLAPLQVIDEASGTLLLALLAAIAAAAAVRSRAAERGPARAAALSAAGVAALFVAGFVAYQRGLWVPVVAPSLAWAATAALVTVWEVERSRRGTPPSTFDRQEPQRLKATVLELQVEVERSHTEKLVPEQLVALVADCLRPMMERVEAHGGATEVAFGDGLRASFGARSPDGSDAEVQEGARRAVACAASMPAVLEEINQRFRDRNLPGATLRIGINTGWMVAGHVVATRPDSQPGFSLVGSEVAHARHLAVGEGLDHDFDRWPCRILIGGATHDCLHDDIESECLGPIRLAEGDEATVVYRVLGTGTRA